MEDMTMKERYTSPEVEIIRFESEDVITASKISDGGYLDEPISGDISF